MTTATLAAQTACPENPSDYRSEHYYDQLEATQMQRLKNRGKIAENILSQLESLTTNNPPTLEQAQAIQALATALNQLDQCKLSPP